MELANILSERLGNQGKGTLLFRVSKSKKIPRGLPPDPPEACAFGARLGNQSVFIPDPRLETVYLKVAIIVTRTL